MRRKSHALVVATAIALSAAACDSGPSGPGSLVASVSGESLGGVVLQIVGPGIRGFEGLGNTQVYAAPLAGTRNGYRVMLVDAVGSDLRFEIQVEDVGMEDPVMTVVSAAGVDNLTQLTAGVEARVER